MPAIRAPLQTNGVTDVIEFETGKQRHINGVVATLGARCAGKPVGSVEIGAAYGMEHAQVIKYLHLAKDAGLVRPVYSRHNPWLASW